MRILLISSFLPYPLYSGGHIRLFNLLKGLARKHKIVLVCEKRNYQTEKDVKELEKICEKVIFIERKKQWSLQNILKTGFSTKAFLLTGHTSPLMKQKIKALLAKEKFDLIHVETFYVYQNLPETSIPIVLTEHNVEYLVYKRFVDKAPLPLRPLLYLDVLKLKYWEEKMWERATKLIVVSKTEKKIMEKKRRDVALVANGVDVEKFKVLKSEILASQRSGRHPNSEIRVLFIGDFKWLENRDAARFILEKIWPSFVKTSEGKPSLKLKLWIVGKNIPEEIKKLGDTNVVFDENAPLDTTLIYEKASILLAPIRIGGGTSFKILEAMASGVPTITTFLGNEGIGATDREEILLAENASDFIKAINCLLQDRNLYLKIAQNARRLIEKKFAWQNIIEKLEDVYKSAVI